MNFEKLTQILLSTKPSILIKDNEEAIFAFIPELKVCKGFKQNNIWHIYDVYEHILHVVDGVEAKLTLRIAALFHDIGKPLSYTEDEKGVGHFYGHWNKSKEIFLRFAKNNNLEEDLTTHVARLIEYHDIRIDNMRDKEIKKIIASFTEKDIDDLFNLKKSDLLAQNGAYHYLLDSYKEQRKRVLDLFGTL